MSWIMFCFLVYKKELIKSEIELYKTNKTCVAEAQNREEIHGSTVDYWCSCFEAGK